MRHVARSGMGRVDKIRRAALSHPGAACYADMTSGVTTT
jgi:hypothetical protein